MNLADIAVELTTKEKLETLDNLIADLDTEVNQRDIQLADEKRKLRRLQVQLEAFQHAALPTEALVRQRNAQALQVMEVEKALQESRDGLQAQIAYRDYLLE